MEARAFGWELPVAALVGWLLAVGTTAQTTTTYEVVHAFRNSGQPTGIDASSVSNLVQASDGYFYGTTYWGGSSGVGTIFRVDSSGNLTTLHSFAYADGANPAAGLIKAMDGNFYGTTTRGGVNNLGTVFRMDAGGTVTRLFSLDGTSGQDPRAALIKGADGNLYGTARTGGSNGDGTAFRVTTGGGFTTLHSFSRYVDGAHPVTELLQTADGNFYGTTSDGGTVFRMNAAGDVTVIHWFNTPVSTPIQTPSGDFYGTTRGGDGNGPGTIFRIDSTSAVATIHTFDPYAEGAVPEAPLVQGADGFLYGTTSSGENAFQYGTLYRVDTTGTFTVLHAFEGSDGENPRTPLTQGADGNLYGTTNAVRTFLWTALVEGTVFSLDPAGDVTTLYRFHCADGALPATALTQATDGNLYGTTDMGGPYDLGTIFRLDASGAVSQLHAFTGPDGAYPHASLLQASDGNFYGATGEGGAYGNGVVFRLNAQGAVTTLHDFDGSDGVAPSELIQASDGKLYGVTSGGTGIAQFGTAFKIDSAGAFFTIGYFNEDLGTPIPPLVEINGKFYGTTAWGGAYALGSVFNMGMDGGITTQYSFSGPDGYTPMAPLTNADGDLWGTTSSGGDYDLGTVFKTIPDSYDLDVKHAFNGTDGAAPQSRLLWVNSGGDFYGVAGTMFSMTYDGLVTPLEGCYASSLMLASDGYIYGVASGGPFGAGVITRLTDSDLAANEISPSSGVAMGETALDILGGGFVLGADVTVGGASGTDVTILDPTFLCLFTPALSPGTLNDVTVTNTASSSTPVSATYPKAFFADFLDVPQSYLFHDYIEKIFRAGITAGCGGGSYCPDEAVTRAQMAVFLLKAEHGSGYVPPACTGIFGDVPCPSLFADWIEQLSHEGITAGCGGGNYCPEAAVTRAQMAVFLLKAEHGPGYVPPPCTGVFGDVPCPSLFANWIEQLAAEQITGGCGGGNYCSDNPNTRGQMAVFLTKTFQLE
jgi:uncharacterized repeat protein (TIGR03803 family)